MPSISVYFAPKDLSVFLQFSSSSNLDHLELERLRGEVVVEAEVELAALLAGVARLDVHVHQRHRTVVPERKLQGNQNIKIL